MLVDVLSAVLQPLKIKGTKIMMRLSAEATQADWVKIFACLIYLQ